VRPSTASWSARRRGCPSALTTAGYLAPGLRRVLRPMLERRGRRNKQKLRDRRAAQLP